MGKIIGAKGETQKRLERESGCKISIRGRGSSTSKKHELAGDDKLHVYL